MMLSVEEISPLTELMNNNNINYFMLVDSGVFSSTDYVEIFVDPSDKGRVFEILRNADYLCPKNRFGKESGWVFGYQLPENIFLKMPRTAKDIFLLINFKLCCKSLTAKTWIPLDAGINERAWKNREWDSEKEVWKLDNKTLLTVIIAKSVFDSGSFSDESRIFISDNFALLESDDVRTMIERIFFKYSDKLISSLKNKEFDRIISDYLSFTEY